MSRINLTNNKLFLLFLILWTAESVRCGSAQATHRIGEADLTLRAATNGSYDDNITYSALNPIEDFVAKFNGGADVIWEQKIQSLSVSGNVNRSTFLDNGRFDNTSYDANVSFFRELSKYDRLRIGDQFSRTFEPRSFEDAFGRSQGRYGYSRNNFTISYEKDVLKQLTLAANYSNQANLISTEDIRDSYLNLAGVDVFYQYSSKTRVGVNYQYSQRSFENEGGDSHTHGLAATLRHYLTSRLYFDVRAGADFITSFDGGDLTRPAFSASLTEEIDKLTTGRLEYRQSYSTSSYQSELFQEWRVSGFLTRRLSERVGVSASIFYGEGEYSSLNRTDELAGGNIGLTYDIRRDWTGNLQYSYSQVESTGDSQSYEKNVVSAGLAASF